MKKYNEDDAWQSIDEGHPDKAWFIWQRLIDSENNESMKDQLKANSCYALLGLKKIDEAREIYLYLYRKHKTNIYAHQLCMVEREAGNYKAALKYLEIEKMLILPEDLLSKAANLYEYGKVNELLGAYDKAFDLAKQCMDASLKCNDLIMLACANRLLGDLYAQKNTESSKKYYIKAKALFLSAKDKVGANEIDSLLLVLS